MTRPLVLSTALACLSACKPTAKPNASATADAAASPGPSQPEDASTASTATRASDDPSGTFEGRRIAQTMGHQGATWLMRPERDEEENTTLLHQQLALAPGDTACDVGAGNGYHTLRMAQTVGPEGRVYASDLQPEMLALLEENLEAAGVDNVRPVLATHDDPKLPEGECDLILLVDVYHELADPAAALVSMRASLSPEGRIALVEYREEDPEVPIKPLHKMSKDQILKEYLPRGFALESQFDGLPWQHLMFFERSE